MFDVYKDNSIKTKERKDRGVASGLAHDSIVSVTRYNGGEDC